MFMPVVASGPTDQLDESVAGVRQMPYRLLAATELAGFLRALAHPRRIQILEELRSSERDVASLAKATGLAHSSVSQHLMVLRAHRVVVERREGRRVFYRLRSVELADWLVQGMDFLAPMDQENDEVRKAIKKAKSKWSD
jgi:DNA-binding transcriptional ArsR family regulator